MKAGRRSGRRILVLVAALAACAPIPSLTFIGEGTEGGTGQGGPDATVPGDGNGSSSGGSGGSSSGSSSGGGDGDGAIDLDAGGGDDGDDGAVDVPSDDAGDAAPTTKCGLTLVSDCVSCPGMPLRCKKGTRDECVSDCTGCSAGFLPCLHCATPDAAPHGTCVPIMANGQIACVRTDLCGCNVDTDCLAIPGAAQTCDSLAPKRSGCLTCGGPTTAGVACVSASGDAGTCQIVDGAAPKCE